MRRLTPLMAALCLVALAIDGGPAHAKPENDLRIGSRWEFKLEGNPGTGYTWRLDAAASHGLDLIKLESLGYMSGKKTRPGMVGAPAPFVFRLTCLKPGDADLWFQYVGPTGKRSKRYEVSVHCH